MSFSDRLRQARKRQGLTQEELGKKSGLSTYTIQRYEYGKLNPKKDTVAKLATALNLGYNYTKSGEPYFYTFVDTVPSPEYKDAEDFNQEQYQNAIEKALEDVTLSTIGEKIKWLRKNKKISQRELAQKTGLSIGSIQGYEQGRYNPKLEIVLKIADALEISPNVFYDDLSQEERESILETKARKADRDNFDSVVNILSNLNDSYYLYNKKADCYIFGTGDNAFVLKSKSVRALQKAIERFIPCITEQLKVMEPVPKILESMFGNEENCIRAFSKDEQLFDKCCKDISLLLCMNYFDVEEEISGYLEQYCIEKDITRKIIAGQGEEWIINPHAGDKTKTN